MRWGGGKVVAWSSLPSSPLLQEGRTTAPPPVIFPFYHLGMAAALPLCRRTNKSLRTVPRRSRLRVQVGEPVAVADLLEAFEDDTGGGLRGRRWEDDPTAAEQELYAAIAARVQDALAALASECGADELERDHGGYDVPDEEE